MSEIHIGQRTISGGGAATGQTGRPSTSEIRPQEVSLGAARSAAPQPILTPSWLPFGDPNPRTLQMHDVDGSVVATINHYRESPGRWVAVRQMHVAVGNVEVPGVLGTSSDAHGLVGFSSTQIPAEGQPGGVSTVVTGFWDQKGYLMVIKAVGLTQSEMLRVRASLI